MSLNHVVEDKKKIKHFFSKAYISVHIDWKQYLFKERIKYLPDCLKYCFKSVICMQYFFMTS